MTEADLTYRCFFGDQERAFLLTQPLINELEDKLGVGIGKVFSNLAPPVSFRHAEILEVIRLALIGGGEDAERASQLVATYAAPRPILEAYGLALAIVGARFNGVEPEQKDDAA